MDPYLVERWLEEKKKSQIFGKNKKDKAYSEDVDLWSIGCTLVFIACNAHAFAAATGDGLIELFRERGPKTIMGSKTGDDNITFSETFRTVSPIYTTASAALQELYINIIRECFKPLDERSYDDILKQVDILKEKGLCYVININEGFGQYDICEMVRDDSRKLFKKAYIDHHSKALKFPVPVRFYLKADQPAATKSCNLFVLPSDPIGKCATVIKSQCSSIRIIYSQTERPHFDINMLTHLCLVECSDVKYNAIEENFMSSYNKEMSEIETLYTEISQIYKDVQKISRKIDLKPLQTRCGKIEKELQQKLKKYARVAFGKRDSGGLVKSLTSLILEEIEFNENPKYIAKGTDLAQEFKFLCIQKEHEN